LCFDIRCPVKHNYSATMPIRRRNVPVGDYLRKITVQSYTAKTLRREKLRCVYKTQTLSDFLDAAAYVLVSERCRQAHIHDMRGELQALHSAIELLARSAKTPGENASLGEKAASLARRALANHEKSLIQLLNLITPHEESAIPLNVGDVVTDAVKLLRSEASRKSVVLQLEAAPDVTIIARPGICRTIVLGFCAMTIDEFAAGALIRITVGRVESMASIEWRSDIPFRAVRDPVFAGQSPDAALPTYELLLSFARRWSSANGGRVELPADSPFRNALRICYPVQ
jgi:hypothetical protein